MSGRGAALILIAVTLVGASAPGGRESASDSYAVRGPLREPRLFGEGVISTPDDEFGGSITPDGRTIYWSRSAPRSYRYVILESHFVNGRWTEPVIPPFSGRYTDSDPTLSPDGRRMFWSSDRPVDGQVKHDYDIWMVERRSDGSWSDPIHLPPPIASDGSEFCASIARDGTLYFSSSRDGGSNQLIQLYRSREINGHWTPPENFTRLIDASDTTAYYDLDVMVDPDQRYVLIGSLGRPEGFGHFDVYVTWNHDGHWTRPFHPGAPINTRARDYSPHATPDGRYLIFASERGFGLDTLAAPLDYRQLETRLRGTLNGSGNLYEVEMSVLDSMAAAAAH